MSWVLHFMARVPFAVIPSRASSQPRVPHARSPGTTPSHRSCHDARAHQGTWLHPEADGGSARQSRRTLPLVTRMRCATIVSTIVGREGQRPTGTQHVMHAFGRHLDQPFHGGLTPSKVQRTTASIGVHLENAFSLVELAPLTQPRQPIFL